jgi:hypothetical protein
VYVEKKTAAGLYTATAGNMSLYSNAVVIAESDSSIGMLFVYGDFINNSTHDIALSYGLLDIKGDYIQSTSTSVASGANVQVQFSGSSPQKIIFPTDENANVHFHTMSFERVVSDSSGDLSPNLNYYTITSPPIWDRVIEKIDSFILSQLIIAGAFDQAGTNITTGNYSQTIEDLSVQTAIGQIKLSHTYNSLNGTDDILGKHFTLSHNMRLTFASNNGVNFASATLPGGIVKSFVQDSAGMYVASNVRASLTASTVNGATQYTVSDPSNTKVVFDANGYIKFIEDNKGNRLHFETNSDNGNIVRMYDSTGVNVIFTYDSQTGKLVEISDISIINAPITASFNYDSNGRLISSTNMNGITMYTTI